MVIVSRFLNYCHGYIILYIRFRFRLRFSVRLFLVLIRNHRSIDHLIFWMCILLFFLHQNINCILLFIDLLILLHENHFSGDHLLIPVIIDVLILLHLSITSFYLNIEGNYFSFVKNVLIVKFLHFTSHPLSTMTIKTLSLSLISLRS
jgi:hypothetical protein